MEQSRTFESGEAAERFVSMLIPCAYDSAIRVIEHWLANGPPGKNAPDDQLLKLHHWFQSLPSQDRAMVLAVVRETAETALFNCLVLLDGMPGGYPVKGELSEFALYLEVYDDMDAMRAERPKSRVRVNSPYLDDLHDVFKWQLQDRKKTLEPPS